MSKVVFRKDVSQTKALLKAAKVSTQKAIRGSKALGLSVTFIKDGVVYEEDAHGNIIVKKHIESSGDIPFEIEKGLVLHGKK